MRLEEVRQAFNSWRLNKANISEPIPTNLWNMVKELCPHYKKSIICKKLHISSSQFKTHCISNTTTKIDDGFIETLIPPLNHPCELILQGKYKTLSIKIPTQQLAMVLPILEQYL